MVFWFGTAFETTSEYQNTNLTSYKTALNCGQTTRYETIVLILWSIRIHLSLNLSQLWKTFSVNGKTKFLKMTLLKKYDEIKFLDSTHRCP